MTCRGSFEHGDYPFTSRSEEWYAPLVKRHRLTISPRVRPVTAIVALKESDKSIWIGSDGIHTTSNGLREKSLGKLHQFSNIPLAWGTDGLGSTGDDFSGWLASETPGKWKSFTETVKRKLAGLNGDQKAITVQLARTEWRNDFACSALIVGWAEGELGIWEFDPLGFATSCLPEGFAAIGGGGDMALIAWKTLRDLPGLSAEEKLRRILTVVATTDPRCGLPIHIWHVEPSGITIIESERMQ